MNRVKERAGRQGRHRRRRGASCRPSRSCSLQIRDLLASAAARGSSNREQRIAHRETLTRVRPRSQSRLSGLAGGMMRVSSAGGRPGACGRRSARRTPARTPRPRHPPPVRLCPTFPARASASRGVSREPARCAGGLLDDIDRLRLGVGRRATPVRHRASRRSGRRRRPGRCTGRTSARARSASRGAAESGAAVAATRAATRRSSRGRSRRRPPAVVLRRPAAAVRGSATSTETPRRRSSRASPSVSGSARSSSRCVTRARRDAAAGCS